MTRRFWLAAMAALTIGLLAPPAQAEDATPAEVWIILGKTEGTSEDKALAKLDALKQEPFASFTHKKLLSKVPLKLVAKGEAETELPNGRKLKLSVASRDEDGRYHVLVSINRKAP